MDNEPEDRLRKRSEEETGVIEIDMKAGWFGKETPEGEESPGDTALEHVLYNGSVVGPATVDGWYTTESGAERVGEGALVFVAPLVLPVRGGSVRVYEEVPVAVPLTDPWWEIVRVQQEGDRITAFLRHRETREERAAVLEDGDVPNTQEVRQAMRDAGVYTGVPGDETAWQGHVLIEKLLAQYGEE